MMNPQDVQSFLEDEFAKVGADVKATSSTVEIDTGNLKRVYKLPTLSQDQRFLPGRFTAGIWDDMSLPSVREMPDAQLLLGWGFTHDEGTTFIKALGPDKVLGFNSSNGLLFTRNVISNSMTEVGPWPTKSVFHAVKLFEENGFYPETMLPPIQSLQIANYRIG